MPIASSHSRFFPHCWLTLAVLAALCYSLPIQALEADTLRVPRCDHSFHVSQLAAPCLLVAAGATGLTEPVFDWKVGLRDHIRDHAVERTYVDDYIQYLPVAMAFAGEWIGAGAQHNWFDRFLLTGSSYAAAFVLINGLKYSVVSPRPSIYDEVYLGSNPRGLNANDHPKCFNSFPSGHTATAFMGAELVRLEYGEENPWIAVTAYAVATGTGVLRVWNEQHWFTDVVAGAGIGMLSARIGWWMLPWTSRVADYVLGLDATHGQQCALTPTATNGHLGMAMCVRF